MSDPEVGRWYAYTGSPDSQKGRPVRIVSVAGDSVLGKWANGHERLVMLTDLGKQVPDAIPGVTEPCLVCAGSQTVPMLKPKPGEPWSSVRVGTKPCPNCRELD